MKDLEEFRRMTAEALSTEDRIQIDAIFPSSRYKDILTLNEEQDLINLVYSRMSTDSFRTLMISIIMGCEIKGKI
jgi:hypothetical protein